MAEIYVQDLAACNAGIEYGKWIDLGYQTEDSVLEEIADMLKSSPVYGKEWEITDTDGFSPLTIPPGTSIQALIDLSDAIDKQGENFADVVEYHGGIKFVDEAISEMEKYAGTFDSVADYAKDYFDQNGDIRRCPEALRSYIDWEKMGDDMDGSDIYTVPSGGRVMIFWNN